MTQARPAPAGWFYGQFMALYGGLFFCHLGIGASLAVLPFYVLQHLHQSDVAVGAVIAAISVAVVIGRPVAGRLADRYGYKLIMLCGAALCALSGAGYFVASSLESVLVVRVVHGLAEALVFTGGATWLVSIAPPERRGKIVGLFGVSMWSGITLGALIGTALLRADGFGAAWAFCLVVPLIGFALVALKPKPDQEYSNKRHAIFPPSALIPGIALALASAGYIALAAFVAVDLAQKGVQNGIIAFNAFGFTYVGVRLVWGHLPDKLGPHPVAFWSGLVEALGLLLVALAPNLYVAIAGGLIMGAGLSLLYPSLALMVIANTEKAQHGTALGMYTSFWDLGLAVGAPLSGYIAGVASYPAIYYVMLGAAVGSAVLSTTKAAQKRLAMQPAASGAERA